MADITITLNEIKNEIDKLTTEAKTDISLSLTTTEKKLTDIVKLVFDELLDKTNKRKIFISLMTLIFTIGLFIFQIVMKFTNNDVFSIVRNITNTNSR